MVNWDKGRAGALVLFSSLALAAFSVSARAENLLEKLELDTAGGRHVLSVEVMRTETERERGLMFRKFMPADRGMLFDFKADRPIEMWMKNTYLPLDMVFIDHAGHVVSIARDAEPMSERIISSEKPTTGVLELNAGAANKLGLKVGDTVKHPMFHP